MNQSREKQDLTISSKLEFTPPTNDPLTVVLVIGESMRGDINSLNGYSSYNNMPLMSSRPHLVSFPKATASATTTRLALPYMLTNAVPPDFEKAMGTKGVISVFKKLGFKTSWIGNQGLFGFYDSNYASNALEADFILSNNDIRIHLNKKLVYDEELLPYIRSRLNEVKSNHLLVVHLLGSHWHFSNRYPASFGHKFTPICDASAVSECTNQELLNSYHNTVAYTDYVLSLILQELADKNAILLYASDHGFSLNEQDLFGNAYEGPNVPKEQLSIEMFSWVSDQFLQKNKKTFNSSKPYFYSNLMYSLTQEYAQKKGYKIDKLIKVLNLPIYTLPLESENLAYLHSKEKAKLAFPSKYQKTVPASAGVFASLNGMIEFLHIVLGNRPNILSRRTLDKMFEPVTKAGDVFYWKILPFRDNEVQSQYCLGWRKLTVKTINKSTLIFHSGYINGATAFVGIIPEHKVGIVILANQSSRFPLKNGLKLWKNIIESNNSTNNG